MIVSFTGDAFLARRAAKRHLAERGFKGANVVEFGAPLDLATVVQAAGQGGLFAEIALLLDLTDAFPGQAGTKPRNELLAVLSNLQTDTLIVICEPEATDARRRALAAISKHLDLPTPRYDALPRWVAAELKEAGVDHDRDVPQLLADIFGEQPAEIASEIGKLSLLRERLTGERVRRVVNRYAARNAFDLIDAIAAGDAAGAVAIAAQLGDEGEAPQRVLGALSWQFSLVAKAVALRSRLAPRRVSAQQVATELKIRPFQAQKALNLAEKLDEDALLEVLDRLLTADVRAKSGGDAQLALESVVIALASRWDAGGSRAAAGRAAPTSRSR